MIRKFIVFLILIIVIKTNAQIQFEPGYFIDNAGKETKCLIKNVDWYNNPTEFEYKFGENDPPKKAGLNDVKEFGVHGYSKYIRATVKMDTSAVDLSRLSYQSKPEFKQVTLFLKVLVEGNANLYTYVQGNFKRYFYSVGGGPIKQLIYKEFYVDDGLVSRNTFFRQQIWNDLKSECIHRKDLEKLPYKKDDLMRIFKQYNECGNQVKFQSPERRIKFRLNVRPKVNFTSLEVGSVDYNLTADFGQKTTFGLGLESEFVMPFNKNKWSLFVEPTFQYFNGEISDHYQKQLRYQTIELPLGARHYFYVGKSAVFVNVLIAVYFDINSNYIIKRSDGSTFSDLKIKSNYNYAFGVGYRTLDRFSIELRFYTRRDLLLGYLFFDAIYKNMSLSVGYTVF